MKYVTSTGFATMDGPAIPIGEDLNTDGVIETGIIATELARACIVIRNRTEMGDENASPNPAICDTSTNTWQGIAARDSYVGRDFPATEKSKDFWTVRIISMPFYENVNSDTVGYSDPFSNQIILCYKVVERVCQSYPQVTMSSLMKTDILHEIGHALGIAERCYGVYFPVNENNVAYPGLLEIGEDGYTLIDTQGIWGNAPCPIPLDHRGCMDYMYYYNPDDGTGIGDFLRVPAWSALDVYVNTYSRYIIDDLRTIQETSEIHKLSVL